MMNNKRKKMLAIGITIAIVTSALIYYNEVIGLATNDFSIGLLITYSNGDTQRYTQPKFGSLIQQKIIDPSNNLEITRLQIELYASLDYVGTSTGWDASGTFGYKIFHGVLMVYDVIVQMTPVSSTAAPPVNTPFVIASATIAASDIENFVSAWTSGDTYRLNIGTVLTFNLKFGSETQTKTSNAVTMDWNFRYQAPNSFNSLSVSWNAVPQY